MDNGLTRKARWKIEDVLARLFHELEFITFSVSSLAPHEKSI